MGMHLGVMWFEGALEAFVAAVVPSLERDAGRLERREFATLGEWLTSCEGAAESAVSYAFVRTPHVVAMLVPSGGEVHDGIVVEASRRLGRVGGATIETSAGAAYLWEASAGVLARCLENEGDGELETSGAPSKFEPPIGDGFYMDEMDALLRNLGLPPLHDDAFGAVGPVVAMVAIGSLGETTAPLPQADVTAPTAGDSPAASRGLRWGFVAMFVSIVLLGLGFAMRG